MKDRAAWVIAAFLAVVCAWDARVLLTTEPGFATLPIFVPVSLEYEKQLRARRGQPPGRGGEEAFALAQALLDEKELDPALSPKVAALRDTRARLLDARGRRHDLNITLMDVGVALASRLTPEQWDQIHMQRDALRATTEAAVFERLLEKLE